MMKKMFLMVVCFCVLCAIVVGASPSVVLTIGGAVKQPLSLSADDLAKFQSVTVRLAEISRDRNYNGVFTYQGVPLKTLLEMAYIEKTGALFKKPLDLAIVVRDRSGKTATLSWGEVFYKNPSDIIIAISATPVTPHHTNCGECHQASFYESALNKLKRKIGFPKLVVANDFFTDRSIEDISHIEIVDLKKDKPKKKMEMLFSPNFTIVDSKGKSLEITDLSGYPQIETFTKEVGDGRGYHGLKQFTGVSLRDLLKKAGVGSETDTVFLVSSPDGYQATFSYGEVFLAPGGERIIVADKIGQKPLKDGGRFLLLPPDDLAADRDVKAVNKIEIISMDSIKKEKGK
ncbi:MAG: hypothetical protein NT178_10455 [Proteobacteria bacterium]|nr:hypothetical protein [Pseudomonadota bacterium]